MNLKQFLKPDWRKIVIFGVLLIIFLLILSPYHKGAKGVPLNYYFPGGGGCVPADSSITCFDMPTRFSLVYLIIDVVFWYLLSCLIVWVYPPKFFKEKLRRVYDKLKKKS